VQNYKERQKKHCLSALLLFMPCGNYAGATPDEANAPEFDPEKVISKSLI
jgi:hypothetical protein